jgi:glutaredoxin
MIIIFYSNKCDYCKKMINYIEKTNIIKLFKLINIDNEKYPESIDIIPTLIDIELNQPLKGKAVFEYLLNIKYFNNPTNSIKYDIPINPVVMEDDKANDKDLNLTIVNLNNENIPENRIGHYPKKINRYYLNLRK